MKRLLILILIVCSVLLTACTSGDSQSGSSERNETEIETIPETESGTAGESATEAPARRTDSEADEPKVTLPKDRF